MRGLNWNKDELKYLRDNIESKTFKEMSKKLGRSVMAIVQKARKLGLSTGYSGDKLYFNQVVEAIGYNGSYTHCLVKWKALGLKIYEVQVKNCKRKMISLDEFWKWAEINQNNLNFKNMEHNALGYEPAWAKEKIKADNNKIVKYKWNEFYTKEEESMLLQYVKIGFTSVQIAEKLRRTQSSIDAKLSRLKSYYRPGLGDKDKKRWSEEEIKTMLGIINNGESYEEVSRKIGRSAQSVKLKYGRMKNELVEGINK